MKKSLLVLFLIGSFSAKAQNVGFGTITPAYPTHIKGLVDTPQLVIDAFTTQSNNHPFIRLRNASGRNLLSLHSDDSTNVFLGLNTGRINQAVLFSDLNAKYNIFIGRNAGMNNTTGNTNSVVGGLSLAVNNIGSNNSALGAAALFNNTSGHLNSALGYAALYTNVTGTNNTGLGYFADVSAAGLFNATAVGYGAVSNASSKVVIGGNFAGMVVGGYAAWSNFSDGRFKQNINENVPGLDFITKLRPVTYTVDLQKLDEHIMQFMPDSIKQIRMKLNNYASANQDIHTGFIAQEVESLAQTINYKFDGINKPRNPSDNYSIAYSQFIMPLVKAVQEQQALIITQQSQIDQLLKRIELLEKK
jgi:hypothetical protein